MKDIDKQTSEIDAKLVELEKEEGNIEERPKRKPLDQTKEAIETMRECVNKVLKIDDLEARGRLKMKDIDKLISEIDAKLAELEKEEGNIEERPKRKPLDQTKEAIETIRECVNEILEIDDLKTSREANQKLYTNRMLTIVSWFNYLKREKQDTKEFEEAKDLILSIGNKHQRLAEWCEELVNRPLPEPPVSLWGAELNVDKTNELIIEDGAKIVVDSEKAKQIIDTEWLIGTKEYNELKFEYKVIVNEKEYDCLYHIVNYIPKCERPEDCPYIVSLTDWEKNSNGERVLKFNVLELGPIIKK